MTELRLELPDGTQLHVPAGTTPLEVAERIGPRLAQAALGFQLNGTWVDLRAPLHESGGVRVITARDPEGGELIRHSAEHLMADAVKRLWPETQIDVGRTDHSEKFQYDLDIPERINLDHFEKIQAEIKKITDADLPFEREVVTKAEAKKLFASMGQTLKVSRIDDLPDDVEITLYRHGDFVDVCRGPHVQRTGQVGAIQLTEVAGSYWRSDEKNPMLQRIYGVAFASKKELNAYLERLEEARKRDHRKLGAELGLFQFHEWSPGSPFYLPKGLQIFNALADYMRGLYTRYGYEEVMCPQLFSAELYKTSGHYDMFKDDMYLFKDADDEEFGIKPMNCPGHCLLFRSTKRSYRELPLRLAEFSRLHRNERSGTLHGMSRVRAMSQDDAHCFCEADRLDEEVDRILAMTAEVYRDLGLTDVRVQVATRPAKFIGATEAWERAEKMLQVAVERAGFDCGIAPGEGAFYGPKIEFHFEDGLGRSWQLSTVQIDMAMPGRFELAYIGRDGEEHEPAMIHRAILGSLERFIAIYLEHTAGALPVWLAPVQVVVLPISDRHAEAAAKVVKEVLQPAGIRAELDARNETLSYRVRSAETQKIPFVLAIGDREVTEGTVAVRERGRKGQNSYPVEDFIKQLGEAIRTRGIS